MRSVSFLYQNTSLYQYTSPRTRYLIRLLLSVGLYLQLHDVVIHDKAVAYVVHLGTQHLEACVEVNLIGVCIVAVYGQVYGREALFAAERLHELDAHREDPAAPVLAQDIELAQE